MKKVELVVSDMVRQKENRRIIAICSNTNGVGKTTLAVNLAVALQRRTGKQVALFDADLFCGNVGVHLNLPRVRSIVDLIRRIDELDSALFTQVLMRHLSGVRVLLIPRRPDDALEITRGHVKRILESLARGEDYVVVDCATLSDERALPALELASDILLIIPSEIGCLKNLRALLDHLADLGLDLTKIHLVLNRANSQVVIEAKQIEQALGQKVTFCLNGGGAAVTLSINRRVPLLIEQPNHPFSQQVSRMADFLAQ